MYKDKRVLTERVIECASRTGTGSFEYVYEECLRREVAQASAPC